MRLDVKQISLTLVWVRGADRLQVTRWLKTPIRRGPTMGGGLGTCAASGPAEAQANAPPSPRPWWAGAAFAKAMAGRRTRRKNF